MKKVKVKARDISSTGEGVAEVNGKVLFVEGLLPEEEAEVSVGVEKQSYAKGELLRIEVSSPHRVTPPCPYFGRCGGCTMQHASVDFTKSLKAGRVKEALKRIGGISDPRVEATISSPSSYGYRNKITLPLLDVEGRKKVGFFAKRSHELVSVEACMLHVPFADEIYGQIKAILLDSKVSFYNEKSRKGMLQHLILRASDHEQKVLVGLIGLQEISSQLKKLAKDISSIEGVKGVVYGRKERANNSIYPKVETLLEGEAFLTEEILGCFVRLSILSFFQVNRPCAQLMYKKAIQLSQIKEGKKVLDLYCGIGSFAIYLAKNGAKVTGIESFAPAVKDARVNAKRNGVDINFECAEVENSDSSFEDYDVIFINPPRKGVHKKVIEKLGSCGSLEIVYTSCDPATLSRDVKLFYQYGYELVKAVPFDMFPQTLHVETIALLKKKDC